MRQRKKVSSRKTSSSPRSSAPSDSRGVFITFEGGEGTGKSTQVKRLAQRLHDHGIETVLTREPGGSAGAEIIRHVLLSGAAKPLGPLTEAILFAAARDDHLQQVIRPALREKKWVICDRFADSTRVYQGSSGELEPEMISALERITVAGTKPDLTLILDVPAETGLQRAGLRRGTEVADRFETEGVEFHQRLRQGFRQLAEKEPSRCVLIDGDGSEEEVTERLWKVVTERFPHILKSRDSNQG